MSVTNFRDLLAWVRGISDDNPGTTPKEIVKTLREYRKRWRETNSHVPTLAHIWARDAFGFCGECSDAVFKSSNARVRACFPEDFITEHKRCDCENCSDCCSCSHCDSCGERCGDGTCSECDCCDSCCDCRSCGRCGDRFRPGSEDFCTHCDRCNNHCSCEHCDNCGDVTEDRCGDCGRGGDCGCGCECDEDDDDPDEDAPSSPPVRRGENRMVEFFTAPVVTFHAPKITERRENPSPRFLAVEIEVAKVDADRGVTQAVRKWGGAIVHDGSLPGGGFEINTAPAGGDKFVMQIKEICDALAASGGGVTDACGLHVHIDARDLGFYGVRRLVQLYAKVEDALYSMVPPKRRESRYCMPCGEHYLSTFGKANKPKEFRAKVHTAVYGEHMANSQDLTREKKNKYSDGRYKALNLHSWFYRGTVECRMFNGSTNVDKITSWGMLWARLVDYAASASTADINRDLQGSPQEVLERVAAMPRLVDFIRSRTASLAGTRASIAARQRR